MFDYSRKFWKWTTLRETNRKHLPYQPYQKETSRLPTIHFLNDCSGAQFPAKRMGHVEIKLIFRPQPTEVVPVYKLYSLTIQELKITHQNTIIWISEMNQQLFCFPSNVKPMSFAWKSSPKILKTKPWNPGTLPFSRCRPNSSKPQVGMEDDNFFLQKGRRNMSLYLNTQSSCIL